MWFLALVTADDGGLDLGESICDWKFEDIINESEDDELETCLNFGGVDNNILEMMESVIVSSKGIANLPHDSQSGKILFGSEVFVLDSSSLSSAVAFINNQRHSSWQVSPQFSSMTFSPVENFEDNSSSQKQHFSFTKDFLFLGVFEVDEDFEYIKGLTFGGVANDEFGLGLCVGGGGGVPIRSLLGRDVVLFGGIVKAECKVEDEETGVVPPGRFNIGDIVDSSSDKFFK